MKLHRIGPGLHHQWRATSAVALLPHVQAFLFIFVLVLRLESTAAARTHGSSRSSGHQGAQRHATVIDVEGVKQQVESPGAPIQQFSNHSVMIEAEAPLMPFLTFQAHQDPPSTREQQYLSSLGKGHKERHGMSLYQRPAAGIIPRLMKYSTAGGLVLKATAVLALLAAVSWGCSKTLDGASGKPSTQKDRACLLDNARFIGSFFVIFGHFIYYNSSGEFTGQKPLLTGAESTLMTLKATMTPMELPLLTFLSGVCSQGEATSGRLQRFFLFLVAPTCIWVFVCKPVIFDTLYTGDFSGSWGRFVQALQLSAFHNEWYLQALIFWRGSAYLIWNNLRPSVALVGMLTLSLVGGYTTFGVGPSSNFKIDETLGFLPYFALGYVFPHQRVLQMAGEPSLWVSSLALVSILVGTGWILPHYFAGQFPDGHGPYGALADGKAWAAAQHEVWSYELYWCRRLAKAVLDMGAVVGLLYLVVPRGRTVFSWAGEHNLHAYVWHLLALVWWDRLVAKCSLPVVTSNLGHSAVIGMNVVVCLLVQVFFCSQPWRTAFAWCFEPTWLQYFGQSQPQQTSTDSSRQLQKEACLDKKVPTAAEELKKSQESSVDSTSEGSLDDHRSESTAPLSETPLSADSHSRPHMQFKAKVALPTMEDSKSFAKCVLPFYSSILMSVLLVFFWMGGAKILVNFILWVPLPLHVFTGAAGLLRRSLIKAYHCWRLRTASQPKPETTVVSKSPDPPLLHVCVVVEYKEPLEVLTRTVSSIACQTNLTRRPVLVLATEARDPERKETCEVLERLCADVVEEFIVTEHTLLPGETVGKHSNENKAVREVWKRLVTERNMSPFGVMITIVDADSILSSTYLSTVENVFNQMPDGRRLIYNGPLNTYRNLSDASMLVQHLEIARCHLDVFHDPLLPYHPQSNYSMTLGLIQEIDFWLPDCISEDMKCHVKALANNFGSRTTVAIPAFICNDTVVQLTDRYVQAKRHQWGSVEEFPWHLKLAYEQPLNFQGWYAIFADEVGRPGSLFYVASSLAVLIMSICVLYHILAHRTDILVDPRIITWAVIYVLDLIVWWAAEVYVWKTSLTEFPIMWPSMGRRVLIALLHPVLDFVASIFFVHIPTLDCIFHITFRSHHLTYVNAPKGSMGR